MTTKSTKAAPAAETVDETAAAAAASAVTAQKVEYDPTTWADGSSGGTPITAAQLNRMETGIDSLATQNNALVDDVTSLGDSLSHMKRSDVADLNALVDTCFFYTAEGPAGGPNLSPGNIRLTGLCVNIGADWANQLAFVVGQNLVYVRGRYNGVWSDWRQL